MSFNSVFPAKISSCPFLRHDGKQWEVEEQPHPVLTSTFRWTWGVSLTLRQLYFKERKLISTERQAVWTPAPDWMFGKRELAHTGTRTPDRPSRSLVVISNEIRRLPPPQHLLRNYGLYALLIQDLQSGSNMTGTDFLNHNFKPFLNNNFKLFLNHNFKLF